MTFVIFLPNKNTTLVKHYIMVHRFSFSSSCSSECVRGHRSSCLSGDYECVAMKVLWCLCLCSVCMFPLFFLKVDCHDVLCALRKTNDGRSHFCCFLSRLLTAEFVEILILVFVLLSLSSLTSVSWMFWLEMFLRPLNIQKLTWNRSYQTLQEQHLAFVGQF